MKPLRRQPQPRPEKLLCVHPGTKPRRSRGGLISRLLQGSFLSFLSWMRNSLLRHTNVCWCPDTDLDAGLLLLAQTSRLLCFICPLFARSVPVSRLAQALLCLYDPKDGAGTDSSPENCADETERSAAVFTVSLQTNRTANSSLRVSLC